MKNIFAAFNKVQANLQANSAMLDANEAQNNNDMINHAKHLQINNYWLNISKNEDLKKYRIIEITSETLPNDELEFSL